VVLDHVDLGDAASEQAHGLTASPASGTNTEAGLTRRYTNAGQPGGWFEFDLRVPAGEPFVLRAIETYNQAQLKTYDVLVDGVRVHQREHRRSEGGAGWLTYQFVVDEPELTADGVVRVRFQDVGEDYDPSIADVWATPVTG
jgi:alpha-L-rhamnosidase